MGVAGFGAAIRVGITVAVNRQEIAPARRLAGHFGNRFRLFAFAIFIFPGMGETGCASRMALVSTGSW